MHSNKPQDLSIEKIPFAGGEIHALNQDGIIFVSLRKVCEELGVNFSSQLQKLKEIASQGEVWAGVVIIATPSAGGEQQTTMLPADSLPMFLITINNNKVKEEIRPKLLQYKNEAAKVLAEYFCPPKQEPKQGNFPYETLLSMSEIQTAVIREMISQGKRIEAQEQNTEEIKERLAAIESSSPLKPKRINSNKKRLKDLRERFHLDVAVFNRGHGRLFDIDMKTLNGELKMSTGRKRENWDIAHYEEAVQLLADRYGYDASRTLEKIKEIKEETIA
jgi:hypothetical protein